MALALKRVKTQEDRVTDAYINEAMDQDRYKAELGYRRTQLERTAQESDFRERQRMDSYRVLQHLERFCHQVAQGLEALTFEERQQLLRLVVERITVDNGSVRIETVIPTGHVEQLRNHRREHVEP